jgi:hypothetical protein
MKSLTQLYNRTFQNKDLIIIIIIIIIEPKQWTLFSYTGIEATFITTLFKHTKLKTFRAKNSVKSNPTQSKFLDNF